MSRLKCMMHLLAGYPNWEISKALCALLEQKGADYLEVQLPFSDPMADGPAIMKANASVLKQGYQLDDAFSFLEELTKTVRIPIYVMSYLNVFYQPGVSYMAKRLAAAGVKGCIVPDLSYEANQKEGFSECIRDAGLDVVAVLAPHQSQERLETLRGFCKSMVYVPSRSGTTGAKSSLSNDFLEHLGHIKNILDVEVAVGFGIHQKEQLDALRGHSDIAVIGTALLTCLDQKDPLKAASVFLDGLELRLS